MVPLPTNRNHTRFNRVWCSGNIVDSHFSGVTALSTAPGSTPGIRVTFFTFSHLHHSFQHGINPWPYSFLSSLVFPKPCCPQRTAKHVLQHHNHTPISTLSPASSLSRRLPSAPVGWIHRPQGFSAPGLAAQSAGQWPRTARGSGPPGAGVPPKRVPCLSHFVIPEFRTCVFNLTFPSRAIHHARAPLRRRRALSPAPTTGEQQRPEISNPTQMQQSLIPPQLLAPRQ